MKYNNFLFIPSFWESAAFALVAIRYYKAVNSNNATVTAYKTQQNTGKTRSSARAGRQKIIKTDRQRELYHLASASTCGWVWVRRYASSRVTLSSAYTLHTQFLFETPSLPKLFRAGPTLISEPICYAVRQHIGPKTRNLTL